MDSRTFQEQISFNRASPSKIIDLQNAHPALIAISQFSNVHSSPPAINTTGNVHVRLGLVERTVPNLFAAPWPPVKTEHLEEVGIVTVRKAGKA